MPRTGARAARADQLATLAGVTHERLVSDDLGRLLESLERLGRGAAVTTRTRPAPCALARHNWQQGAAHPSSSRAETAEAESLAEHAWEEAREDEPTSPPGFPTCDSSLDLKRRYIDCFDGSSTPTTCCWTTSSPG